VINFIVFTVSAWIAPAFGWLPMRLAGGAPLSTAVFQGAGIVWVV
jgi:hypothetical protein